MKQKVFRVFIGATSADLYQERQDLAFRLTQEGFLVSQMGMFAPRCCLQTHALVHRRRDAVKHSAV